MWISRVEDFDTKRDSVQVSNPFTMQNNANGLRSALSGRAMHRAHAAVDAVSDVGVIVSLSNRRGTNSVQNSNALIGVDMNLFAAD